MFEPGERDTTSVLFALRQISRNENCFKNTRNESKKKR